MEVLANHQCIVHNRQRMIVRTILDSNSSDVSRQYFYLPGIVVGCTAPSQIDIMRRIRRLMEVIRLDTRGVLQLHIVNQHITIHHQATQTRSDGNLVVRQLIIREDETCFLKRRTTHLDGIERHEGALVLDILHRTYNHHSGRRRERTYVKRKQHIRQISFYRRQNRYRAMDRTGRIEVQRFVS